MKLGELSDIELEELAADATAALNSKGLKYVLGELREHYVQELVQADVGSLTAGSYHARMKVLEDVVGELKRIATEQKIRKKR